ncbi:MAG: tyrosine-type recombinase/integrase [Thermomicrobiales bacterium]
MVWSHEDVSAFLSYVEEAEDRFRVLWHLALTTGMRRGELLGLRWEDIDFSVYSASDMGT